MGNAFYEQTGTNNERDDKKVKTDGKIKKATCSLLIL